LIGVAVLAAGVDVDLRPGLVGREIGAVRGVKAVGQVGIGRDRVRCRIVDGRLGCGLGFVAGPVRAPGEAEPGSGVGVAMGVGSVALAGREAGVAAH
jgi:hypothetical protein